MYEPTTQYNSKNIIKCFGCLSLSLICVLSLNVLINRLINQWPFVGCFTNQPSFKRRLNSSTSRTEF